MPVEVATAATGTTTMEITVSKFELLRELTATQGVVERKTTIPILSNYLFEAGGDKLSLTATDLDLSLRTSCSIKVKKEGSCTIPARKLHDYVKLLPDADITIKLLENHWVSIRCGRSNTKMVGMAQSNFPSLPAFPTAGVVKIPAQVLRSMIAKTGFAIASEESRYTLNGALMVLKPESITMVATDGHRLSHIERSGEKFDGISGEMKTLIPKKAMDELKSLLDGTDTETIDFAKDESTLYFRIGTRLLTSRQLTGQFPNYEAVLPKDNSKSITVNGEDLSAAISRVAQFADAYFRSISDSFHYTFKNQETIWYPVKIANALTTLGPLLVIVPFALADLLAKLNIRFFSPRSLRILGMTIHTTPEGVWAALLITVLVVGIAAVFALNKRRTRKLCANFLSKRQMRFGCCLAMREELRT